MTLTDADIGRLRLSSLVARIISLPREDRWQTMARAALRDDLYNVHAQLTGQVITETSAELAPEDRVEEWVSRDAGQINRGVANIAEICSEERTDLARLSVGLRVVRSLLAPGSSS